MTPVAVTEPTCFRHLGTLEGAGMSCSSLRRFDANFDEKTFDTLPETNSEFAPENRPRAPIGKDRIPTIHLQVRKC